MKTPKRTLGDKGESIAAQYLSDRGYKIIATNYLKPWGEIDIISKRGEEYHFIEVKTQTTREDFDKNDFYEAEEKVDYKKRARLRRVIETYLLEKDLTECDYCVDVMALYLNKEGEVARIEYIEDITL